MISIVIPTVNHLDLVKQCVQTFCQTVSGIQYEIIVVDDGSPEQIRQALSHWASGNGVRLIAKPNNEGFSRTVNRGIVEAAGQYVLILNNDIVFHEAGWLEHMIQVIKDAPDVGIVGARLLYPNLTLQHAGVFPSRNGSFYHRYRGFPADYPPAQAVEDQNAVTGALMLIRKDVISDIGMFSEQFFIAFEDIDFCYRAKQKGWRIVYCGKACAIHLEGQTRGNRLANKNRYWRIKELESRRQFWLKWRDGIRHEKH